MPNLKLAVVCLQHFIGGNAALMAKKASSLFPGLKVSYEATSFAYSLLVSSLRGKFAFSITCPVFSLIHASQFISLF